MAMTYMFLFKKSFEETVVPAFITGVMFLYVGGMCNNIKLGVLASLLFAMSWIPIIIYKLVNRQETIKSIFKKLFSIGFIVFCVLFIFVHFYTKYSSFNYWDEFTHWGPMIKEMYRLNKFYTVEESMLDFHKDYPPFTSLLELLWCYLRRGYYESTAIESIAIFSISLFIPLFKNTKLSIKTIFLSLLCCLLLIGSFFIYFEFGQAGLITNLSTIYPDALCGLYSAFLLYMIVVNNESDMFSIFNLSISLASLLLIKQVTLSFYLLLLFYFLIKHIFISKDFVFNYLGVVILPIFVYLSWKFYINSFDISRQFSINTIDLIDSLKTIFGLSNTSYRITTFNNFKKALIDQPIFGFGNINYPLSAILISILIIFIVYLFNKKEAPLMTIICLLGMIGYSFMMCILYLTSFSEYEAINLASYNRYMSTYIYFLINLFIMLICHYALTNRNIKSIIILIFFCILTPFTFKENIKNLTFYNEYHGYESKYKNKELFDQIDTYINSNDKVLIVTQYKDDWVELYLGYRYLGYNFDFVGIGTDDPLYDINISYDEWVEYYSQYDYVYTYITNEQFYQEYWNGKQDEAMLENRLYSITNDDKLVLVPWLSSEEY